MPKTQTETRIDYEPLLEFLSGRRVSNSDVGKIVGCTPATVGRWFNLNLPMPGGAIVKLADYFGWDAQKIRYYALNGPVPVYKEEKRYITIRIEELEEALRRLKSDDYE